MIPGSFPCRSTSFNLHLGDSSICFCYLLLSSLSHTEVWEVVVLCLSVPESSKLKCLTSVPLSPMASISGCFDIQYVLHLYYFNWKDEWRGMVWTVIVGGGYKQCVCRTCAIPLKSLPSYCDQWCQMELLFSIPLFSLPAVGDLTGPTMACDLLGLSPCVILFEKKIWSGHNNFSCLWVEGHAL